VGDGDEEERVAGVGNTGEGVVPWRWLVKMLMKETFDNETYHAVKAARIPKAPPALRRPVWGAPSLCSKYERARNRKAMSSVKKSVKKATVERSVQISSRKVKMNQPMRYSPKESRKGVGDSASNVEAISKPPGVRMMAVPIQKPPYEDRAVAPKVLPRAISL
jgi:hypothetical protein